MVDAQGFKTSLLIGEEVTYGTIPGSLNMWKFPIVKPGIKGKQNLLTSKVLLDDPNARTPASGNRMVDGGMEIEVSEKSFGWILKWLFGPPTSTQSGGGTGYLVNNGAGYPAGATTLVLDTGTGTVPVNTWVEIGGKPYRVNTQVGGATVTSITIDGGLLAAVLDNATVTVMPNTYYGHKYLLTSASAALIPSLVCEEGHSDLTKFQPYSGCYVDKASFKMTPEGIMSITVDVMGKQFTFSSSSVGTGTVTDPGHAPFSYFGATIFQGGSLLGIVKSLDFTVDSARDGNQFVIDGTGTRHSIPAGIRRINGTMKVLYVSDALNTIADAGTTTSLRTTIRNNHYAADLYFPEVRLEVSTPDVVSEAIVEQDHPFQAFYASNADASMCVATLWNQNASYAAM